MFIQLYRSHDEATSDPIEFRYKPIDIIDGNRKRPRTSSSGYDTDVSGVSDQSSQHRIQPNRQVQQNPNPSLDEVFALMPELNKVEYNPKGNQMHQQSDAVAQTMTTFCFLSLLHLIL